MFGLTNKEYIQLRQKTLEPFVATASKAGIEQDTILRKAELAWEFATKGIGEAKQVTTVKVVRPPVRKKRSK